LEENQDEDRRDPVKRSNNCLFLSQELSSIIPKKIGKSSREEMSIILWVWRSGEDNKIRYNLQTIGL